MIIFSFFLIDETRYPHKQNPVHLYLVGIGYTLLAWQNMTYLQGQFSVGKLQLKLSILESVYPVKIKLFGY